MKTDGLEGVHSETQTDNDSGEGDEPAVLGLPVGDDGVHDSKYRFLGVGVEPWEGYSA